MVIDDKDLHPGLCDTRHKAVELPGRTSVILQERGTRRPYRFYPTDNILEAKGGDSGELFASGLRPIRFQCCSELPATRSALQSPLACRIARGLLSFRYWRLRGRRNLEGDAAVVILLAGGFQIEIGQRNLPRVAASQIHQRRTDDGVVPDLDRVAILKN